MARTATIDIRIDPEVNMSLPRYNTETLAAIQEAWDISSGKIKTKSYASVKEMVAELDSDDEKPTSSRIGFSFT